MPRADAAPRTTGADGASGGAPGFTIDVSMQVVINASPERVFRALVDEVGEWFRPHEDGKSFGLKIEPVVGGRMFRDLGEGAGHLWGHVQVIKPPVLLEIIGPMFISYPTVSHLQYRLSEDVDRTTLTLTHRASGYVPDEMLEQVQPTWTKLLQEGLKPHVERNR